MIGERPLRYARRLNDVTHAGTHVAALEHNLKAVSQYFVFIGDFPHLQILRPYIVSVNLNSASAESGTLEQSRVHLRRRAPVGWRRCYRGA
jgi:hypothetical protein